MDEFLDYTKQQGSTKQLGQTLKDKGLVDDDTLNQALTQQKSQGGRLGNILTHRFGLRPLDVSSAIAEQLNVEFIDLQKNPPPAELLQLNLLNEYIINNFIPYQKIGANYILACCEPSAEFYQYAHKHYGKNVQLLITSKRDIYTVLTNNFSKNLDEQSRLDLWKKRPDLSAKRQKNNVSWLAFFLISATITAFFCFPYPVIIGNVFLFFNLIYCVSIGFKICLYMAKYFYKYDPAQFHYPHDEQLPIYSILVPLYKEAKSVPHILANLRALDYPPQKLDIKLVVEADDESTISAIIQARPEAMFEIIRVPASEPRTKPKACNYALNFIHGEFVAIFDAEDKPDILQLKKAVALFRSAPPNIICLQARLNYYNANHNLLTRFFSIEYASLFNFVLPGSAQLKMPIPLGGTSNHIRSAELKNLLAWDPFNVTEDADLGMRVYAEKGKIWLLDSLTQEEAPTKLWAWTKQRTRWIKGYMQTWLVCMRHPIRFYRAVGFMGFVGFQLLFGSASLVYLSSPFLWSISLYWLIDPPQFSMLSENTINLSFILLVSGLISQLILALVTMQNHHFTSDHPAKWHQKTLAILGFPFYFILHSIACFRALWQLAVRPYYWDKTEHNQ